MRIFSKIPSRLLLLALIAGLLSCSDEVVEQQDFEQKLTSAVAYRQEGQLEEAVIELKNALQLNPAHLEARLMLGELYLLQGDAVDADKEFRIVQDRGGDPSRFLVNLGDALLRLNNWQEVLSRIQPDPALPVVDQARIHAQRGSAYIGLKDIDAAQKAFTAAIELDPDCVPAWLGQVALVMEEGRHATAGQLIEQALAKAQGEDAAEAWRMKALLAQLDGDIEAAESAYGKAIELSAFKGTLQIARALLRIETGDYPGAREDLDAVAGKFPYHPDVFYGEGLLAIREGRFSEAREYLNSLKQLIPDSVHGLFYLGVADFAEGNLKDAETYLAQVVEQSSSVTAALLLGHVRYGLGEYHAAARVLEPLLAHQPDNSELQSLLGSVYIAIGETALGSKLLRDVVVSKTGSISDQMRLGLSLVRLGDNDAGVIELEKVAADDPGSDQPKLALMIGYVHAGKYQAARVIAQNLVEAAADQPAPWNYLGMVELVAGDRAAARKAFERAFSLAPGWPVAGFNLARLEQAAGNVEQAKVLYEEILAEHPKHLRVLLSLMALEAATGNQSYAEQLAERTIKLYPTEIAPRLWLARKYLADGDAKKSLVLFEEIEAHYREDADFLAVLGEARLLAGETMSGMKTFRDLAERAPKDADIQYMYARACAIHMDYLCLGEALIVALRLQPDHPGIPVLVQRLIALSSGVPSTQKMLWRLRNAAPDNIFLIRVSGEYALRNDRARDAIAIYQEARERFPNQWDWWGQLTYARARNGEYKSALTDIREWLALHPEETAAWLLKGKVLLADGKPDQARETFAHVLKLDPDNVQALNNLAWLLRDSDAGKARRYAERALALEPGYITRDTLGVILLNLGEHDEAERLLRQAFGEQPQSAEIRYHLAQALVNLQRVSEARSLLKELLQEAPAFSEREQAEQLFQQVGG